jgi:NADPH:quinone reductase-like Zn-dependent oxidoreductase
VKQFILQQSGGGVPALAEAPEPRPGPGQVVLRMKAASLNYRDLVVARGKYGKVPDDLIPLSDGVGEVVDAGSGVTRVSLGDRVAGAFMQTWISGRYRDADARSALGGSIHGMLAEFVCLDQQGLVHVPEFLTDEEAASLPCAAVTAWNALFDSGNVQPGDSVLVQGTGGVSIFALQFARLAGARVLATSSSDAKLERLRQLGADETVNYIPIGTNGHSG